MFIGMGCFSYKRESRNKTNVNWIFCCFLGAQRRKQPNTKRCGRFCFTVHHNTYDDHIILLHIYCFRVVKRCEMFSIIQPFELGSNGIWMNVRIVSMLIDLYNFNDLICNPFLLFISFNALTNETARVCGSKCIWNRWF